MKPSYHPPALIKCLACIVLLNLLATTQQSGVLHAQQKSSVQKGQRRADFVQNNSSPVSTPPPPSPPPPQDASAAAAPQVPRERRAQAYIKLLEGQRYLSSARGGGEGDSNNSGSGGSGSKDSGGTAGQGSLQLAQQAFEQAASLDPTLAEARTALAEIAFVFLNDFAQAEREATTAVRADPNNFGAHRILSRVYTLKSGLRDRNVNRAAADRSIAELREVTRLVPNDAEAWALLGELYEATGRDREAIEAFTRWAAAPASIDPRFFQVLTQGGELAPDVAAARLGQALLRVGRTQEAIAALRRAVSLEPANTRYQELLGLAQARAGKVDEGVALLRGNIKGTPEDYRSYLIISSIYLQAGRGREAVEAARKALELAPTEQPEQVNEALVLLSSAQERAGDHKGAEESLRRILAKEPNNPTALNNLGYFLIERNERLPEALEMIQQAVRAQPANPSFLDSLGWVYFKLQKFEEAERHLSEAARRDETSVTIQEHLGDVYFRRGKIEQARAAWQKALSLSFEPTGTSRIKAKLNGESK